MYVLIQPLSAKRAPEPPPLANLLKSGSSVTAS